MAAESKTDAVSHEVTPPPFSAGEPSVVFPELPESLTEGGGATESVFDSPIVGEIPVPVAKKGVELPIDFDAPIEPRPALQRKKTRKKSVFKVSPRILLSTVLGLLLIGGVSWFVFLRSPATIDPVATNPAEMDTGDVVSAMTAAVLPTYSRDELRNDPSLIHEFVPTHGEPITLQLMPSGVNLIVHWRPALLWSEESNSQVLRASLTDEVSGWISETLRPLLGLTPDQIEEVTFGFLLEAFGTQPRCTAVVRLKDSAAVSSWTERVTEGDWQAIPPGEGRPAGSVNRSRGVIVRDEKTLVVTDPELVEESLKWIDRSNHEVSLGMENLLQQTDRERLLTVVASRADLNRHLSSLLPGKATSPFQNVLDWLGEDVEYLSLTFHHTPYFFSDCLLIPASLVGPRSLQDQLAAQSDKLPEYLWKEVCAKFTPRDVRTRTFVGRFPAMMEAARQATVSSIESRRVRMTTVMPAKAAPNLALASLFTVQESQQAVSARPVTTPATTSQSSLPARIVDRLNRPVDAEFNQMPLEQAMQYLCDEIQVKLVVHGDALKDAGYTRNMPQTFNLGRVPVQQAMAEILNKYQEPGKEMVISIDDAQGTITLLTNKFAELEGKPVHQFP